MAFPDNDLERGLSDAAEGRRSLADWLEELVTVPVYVPMQQASGGGATFPVLTIDGQTYLAAYTSESELAASGTTSGWVHVSLAELVPTLPAHLGVAVNPGGTLGLPVSAGDLRRVVSGEGRIAAGSTVRVGHPAEEPTEVLEAVAGELRTVPSVKGCRRCWAAVGENTPGLVLGVDIDPDVPEQRRMVVEAVGRAARSVGYRASVDVVFANDRDALTEWMHANAEPFLVA